MNVALFSDSWLPTKSGVVTVVLQLRRALEEAGCHVVVVTVCDDGSTASDDENGTILRIPSIHSPVGDNQYIGIPYEWRVTAFCKKHGIQIIHAHTEFTLGHLARAAGRALGIPVVATTHTMWEDYYRYYLRIGRIIPKAVVRRLVHSAYRNFYALINVSQKAHDYFKSPAILPSKPSVVIPNAIDADSFCAVPPDSPQVLELRKKFGIEEGDAVLLYVGRVVEEKRVKELLDALSRVVVRRGSRTKVLFVGDGATLKPLEAQAESSGLSESIRFSGFVDWRQLPAYYALGTVFVTASLSEMHSMTVLEAMQLRLPVVCRRDTSFADTVVPGRNGFLADSDEELSDMLCSLLDDPGTLRRMGDESYAISRGFTLGNHLARTLAVYGAVLSRFPGPVTDAELSLAVASALNQPEAVWGGV